MQIKDVEKLKAWLFNKLEPLCDADPTALSKYVVALLRKEKPKAALKELCIDQLEVFLAKETVAFVDKLFRCLESESYLKREETPPPSTTKSKPAEQIRSSGQNVDKKQAEDIGQKEVDDDDRDFRRSKRHDLEGNGDLSTKRPTAPISTSRVDSTFAGKKRRNEDSVIGSLVKRRVIESRSRTSEPTSSTPSTVMDSTSTAASNELTSLLPASVRRSVRERLGPRPEDRSDGGRSGGRRHHRGQSSTHSRSSSSESGSGSESESSTGSSMGGGKLSKKRKKQSDHSRVAKKRQRCKDYDEKGFCILGESCPYDHGVDPVVIGGGISPYPLGLPPPPGLPLPPLGKPNLLVQPLLPPVLPRPASPPPPPTTSTDGYNPEDPGLSSSSSSRGFIPTPVIHPHPLPLQQSFPPPSIGGISLPPPSSMMSFPPSPHLSASTTLTASTNFHHQMRLRPPTHFSGRAPMKPSDTLIIRKVPRELNTITKLSSHFEKFGTIVNLTVRYEGDPEGALVQFSNPTEAKKAHSSTEAVLNNRFIKIFFLRKDHVSAQMPLTEVTLESPASLAISTICGAPPLSAPPLNKRVDVIESVTRRESSENHVTEVSKDLFPPAVHHQPPAVKTSPSPTSVSAPPQAHVPPHPTPPTAQQRIKSAEAAKKKLELQRKTHELLQRQIQQQKLLISKLEKSGKHLSANEKDSIMKSLKTLASSISKLKEAASKTVTNKNKPEAVALKSAPIHEELQQKQPSTIDLKAKAEALRKQAHMLGLLSSPSQPLPSVGKGCDRNPDLRSKLSKYRQLLVMNVTNRDQLTSYFDSFGGLERVEVDPSNSVNLIFTFRNKTIANQVVNKGSVLNGKPLIMKWYIPKPEPPHPTIAAIKTSKLSTLTLPHHHSTPEISESISVDTTMRRVVIEGKSSTDDQPLDATTPTLTKLDPKELHLVEDSDEEDEGRSWRR